MNKLKMSALAALAAVVVGTGVLAAAPSASAQRPSCAQLKRQALIYDNVWLLLKATGYGHTNTAYSYLEKEDAVVNEMDEMGCAY